MMSKNVCHFFLSEKSKSSIRIGPHFNTRSVCSTFFTREGSSLTRNCETPIFYIITPVAGIRLLMLLSSRTPIIRIRIYLFRITKQHSSIYAKYRQREEIDRGSSLAGIQNNSDDWIFKTKKMPG